MIIGTAGHIDHGKTALVRALTGVDTDRLKEEKERGITIDLGFAYLPAPGGSVLGFVDVPGHEKFVRNMLAGATGIDFVLLVVAADDGVMPQTIEHLAIVNLLGIEQGVVALTKADLADAARRAEVAAEVARLLGGTRLAGADILPVSTVTGEGIDALRLRLLAAGERFGARAGAGRFRLAVDRSFTLTGAGTIVTGTVLSGAVAVGDRLIVSPSGRAVRIRAIHAQNRPVERGGAGERCALNLAGEGISKDAVARGDIVLDPQLHAPTARIDATLRLLASETRPIGQWTPVRLHHAAADIAARIVLLGDPVPPGGEGLVQLVLERPIAAAAGDRFVLRDTTAQRTIGGGRFLDLRPPTRKRSTPERLQQLAAHAIADPERSLAALLACPPSYADLTAFARDRALSAEEIEKIAGRLRLIRIAGAQSACVLLAGTWSQLKRNLVATLATFHAENPDVSGMGVERLRLQLEPRLPGSAFRMALQAFAQSGDVALDGAWVRLPGHEVRLTPNDEALWETVEPILGGSARFRPPRVRDIAGLLFEPEPEVRRLLKLLSRTGRVDEVAQDHFFLRETVAEIVAILTEIGGSATKGEFTAAKLRDRLDNGRKVAIQILEFFDRHGVTLRRGDRRRVNPHRLDLFRPAEGEGGSKPGGESSPVGRPDFKSGRGREPVFGGFDSHSPSPPARGIG